MTGATLPGAGVLLIEDDPEVLPTFQEILADLGYEVLTAADAGQGLAPAQSARPDDVVVLDLVLPGQSGFDLLTQLHDRRPDVPVIAITANIQPEIERQVRARGAFGYLAKPVDFAVVGDLLDAARHAREQRPAARHTVLYIEDNAANVRLVGLALSRHTHLQLLTARTGAEGRQLIRERRPDLILLDLHLPDMEGADLLAEVQNDQGRAGAQGDLEKPLDLQRFYATLDAYRPRPR